MATVTDPADKADAVRDGNTARTVGSALNQAGHEQVVFCHDAPTGLRAIIAIYSTALGPALGGTRFYPYASEDAAIADVLNLSKAMAYKNAMAGLDHGGGKAVIIGDPDVIKSEALLRAYGRFVESLNGRYITACDIGTYSQDMDIVARESRHVTGRTEPHGGAGDSSVLTALGVFQGMRAAAEHAWGSPSLRGRSVAVEGVGKVGSHLVTHLIDDGASVTVYDINDAAVQRVSAKHPAINVARHPVRTGQRRCRHLRSLRAGRRDRRRQRWPCSARRSSAGAPTTSWRTPASTNCSRTTASCTPRTTW